MNKKLFLGFIFILAVCLSQAVSGALTDDNVGYYSFDDTNLSGSNPLDLSGNSNTGITTGATTGVSGLLSEGFSFDGTNDYISTCLLYTSPSPRDGLLSRMPSSA